MTLDERVLMAIQEVYHIPSGVWPQYIAAFTEAGREEGKSLHGNRYRWLLDENGKVFRWKRFYKDNDLQKDGTWVPATKRMTKIIRMKVWPVLTFD